MSYNAVDVTASATLIITHNAKRKELWICNTSNSTTVYVGENSDVTPQTGFPLFAWQSQSRTKGFGTYLGSIYGVVNSGTVEVRYWEIE